MTDWTPQPTKVPGDSCDEYPFAGSTQSAGAIPGFTSGAACAQVIATKDKAGNFTGVAPLGKYAKSDKCVRGHVPFAQNRLAGLAYASFVRAERLLPGDPFWVAVTG